METEKEKILRELYKEYNITDEPIKPAAKPAAKSVIKSVIESIKSVIKPTVKKKRKKVSLPSGVRTPSDVNMVLDILDLKKDKQKEAVKPRK